MILTALSRIMYNRVSTLSVLLQLTDRAAETEERVGQGRSPAVDLSSFRTYLARLSAGYSRLRSGENDSSLGNRPFSPTAPDFPQALLTSRRPVLPQPGAVLLGGAADRARRDSNHDTLSEEERFDPRSPIRNGAFRESAPYKIEKTGEDAYRLTRPWPGSPPAQLDVTVQEDTLLETGKAHRRRTRTAAATCTAVSPGARLSGALVLPTI
jgi:HSP20 family molecular chaperone IbpA